MSEHFKRYEFACKCGCGFAAMDEELIKCLEDVRSHFGDSPVMITSGCRCETHNKYIGGSSSSYHTKGLAADFKVKGTTPHAVGEYLRGRYADRYGVGTYANWTHLDMRDAPGARWWET